MTFIVTSFQKKDRCGTIYKGDKMFTERLNIAIGLIGATNAEIAGLYGCDRSNISRIRSGNRIPASDSLVSRKLVAALAEFAYNNGTYGAILDKIGLCEPVKRNEAEAALMKWLYSGDPNGKKSGSAQPFRYFGEKLGASMVVAKISNIRLARALNVDPSHISRFRNGQRTPKSNPKLVTAICDVLLERCTVERTLAMLSGLTGIPESELSREVFKAWLCDFNVESYGEAIEELINSVSGIGSAEAPDPGEIEELPGERAEFFGTGELKKGILNLLAKAVKRGAEELLFYSDQKYDWIREDQAFLSEWSSYMLAVVNSGIRVRTIHSLDKEPDEIVETLRRWLPLYVSGSISAYYTKKQPDMQFSHFLIIAPGIGAISGTCLREREKTGTYYYHSNHEIIRQLTDEYNVIQKNASPFATFGKTEFSDPPKERIINDIKLSLFKDAIAITQLREPFNTFMVFHPALVEGCRHLFGD